MGRTFRASIKKRKTLKQRGGVNTKIADDLLHITDHDHDPDNDNNNPPPPPRTPPPPSKNKSYKDIEKWVQTIVEKQKYNVSDKNVIKNVNENEGKLSESEMPRPKDGSSIQSDQHPFFTFKRIDTFDNNFNCLINSILTATSQTFRHLTDPEHKRLIAIIFRDFNFVRIAESITDKNRLSNDDITIIKNRVQLLNDNHLRALANYYNFSVYIYGTTSKKWRLIRNDSDDVVILYNRDKGYYETIYDPSTDAHENKYIFSKKDIESYEYEESNPADIAEVADPIATTLVNSQAPPQDNQAPTAISDARNIKSEPVSKTYSLDTIRKNTTGTDNTDSTFRVEFRPTSIMSYEEYMRTTTGLHNNSRSIVTLATKKHHDESESYYNLLFGKLYKAHQSWYDKHPGRINHKQMAEIARKIRKIEDEPLFIVNTLTADISEIPLVKDDIELFRQHILEEGETLTKTKGNATKYKLLDFLVRLKETNLFALPENNNDNDFSVLINNYIIIQYANEMIKQYANEMIKQMIPKIDSKSKKEDLIAQLVQLFSKPDIQNQLIREKNAIDAIMTRLDVLTTYTKIEFVKLDTVSENENTQMSIRSRIHFILHRKFSSLRKDFMPVFDYASLYFT